MKVVLEYDYVLDGQRIYKFLSSNKIRILKIKNSFWAGCKARVTIVVHNYDELMDIIYQLNDICRGEVRLIKYSEFKPKQR